MTHQREETTMSEVLTRADETSMDTSVKKAANSKPSSIEVMKKAAKFRTIGTKRVNSALKRIALIGNLSSRASYAYSDGDIKKLTATLRTAIDRMEARFTPSSKDTDSFSF